MSTSSPSLGNEIYSGAAELGKFKTTIGLFFGIFFGIVLLIIGIVLLKNSDQNKHTQQVSANIVKLISCNPYSNNNQLNYSCNFNISYEFNNKAYLPPNTIYVNTTRTYNVGDSIDIYIDPNNPSDYSQESKKQDIFVGYFIIGISLIVSIGSIVSWWLSQKYKLFAAYEGASVGLQLFR
jgi:TM2 domain-containing membrane protein YozV